MTGSRRVAVSLVAVGMLLSVLGLWRPALAGAPSGDFQGVCTSTTFPMTCTLDEPEGNNPATHGTITITRVGNVYTFVWNAPAGATLSPGDDSIKLCVEPKTGATNPYVPTNANTCVGADSLKFGAFPVVYDATALLAGTGATDIWFALHVDIRDDGDRTTYVVGTGTATIAATTTTAGATTTTAQLAATTTTATTAAGATTTTAAGQAAGVAAEQTQVLGVVLEADRQLPATGAPIAWALVLGLGLVGLGVALLLAGRRHARTQG